MWRGWQLEWIVVLCAQRNSTTQRRSTLKRLCCRSSLSLTQRDSLSALFGLNVFCTGGHKDYCRSSEGQVSGRQVGQTELSLK